MNVQASTRFHRNEDGYSKSNLRSLVDIIRLLNSPVVQRRFLHHLSAKTRTQLNWDGLSFNLFSENIVLSAVGMYANFTVVRGVVFNGP